MPNTSVRAAAEGMPAAINRRTILTGIGAASAAAVTLGKAESSGLAKAGSFQERKESPMNMINHRSHFECADAELFRLDKELEEAHARMETASEANSTLSHKIEALLPPRPLHPTDWEAPPMPAHLEQLKDDALKTVSFLDVATKDGWKPEPLRAWREEIKREKAQVQAEWEEWSALRAARYREHNYDAMEKAFSALCEEEWEIGMGICAIPAHTLEGMMVKLRVSDRLGLEDFGDPNEAFLSIATDIRRLADGGPA